MQDSIISTAASSSSTAMTTTSTVETTVHPCTECTDKPNIWMVQNPGKWSTTGRLVCADMNDWVKEHRCVNDARWVRERDCRQTCFEIGKGYAGDHCCTIARVLSGDRGPDVMADFSART